MFERPTMTAFRPEQVGANRFEQYHPAERGTGHDASGPCRHQSDIDGVEAIDILGRIDRAKHFFGVDLGRKRELHQNSIDGIVVVERCDERKQFGLRTSAGGTQTRPCPPPASAWPSIYVDFAGWIISGQDDRKPRLEAAGHEFCDVFATVALSSAAAALPSMI